MQLSTKDTSSFSLPLTTSQGTSTSTTPSSSVEGLRDELASDRGPSDSSLSQHQLRTALTAETVETRSSEPHLTAEDDTAGMSSGPSRSVGLGDKQLTETSVHSGQSLGQSLGQSSGQSSGQDEVNSGTGHDEKQLDGDKKLPDSGGEKGAVPGSCANQGTGTEQIDGAEDGILSASAEGVRVGGANSPDLSSGPRSNGVVERTLQQESVGSLQSQGSAVPISVSSQSSTPLGRHRQSKPSPIATPTTQPLSRSSSIESPTSPFFIPSNPFLSVVGRMPKFQWSSSHIQLLDDLLKSLLKVVGKWTENKCVVLCTHLSSVGQ